MSLVILPRLPARFRVLLLSTDSVWRSSLFTSLFRPLASVCVRGPPRHLTHACAQLECRSVRRRVSWHPVRQAGAGRGRAAEAGQQPVCCFLFLPSFAVEELEEPPVCLSVRLSECRSSPRLVSSTHFLPFVASPP